MTPEASIGNANTFPGRRDGTEAPSLREGDTFGPCRIIRFLGRGGMGEVYLAKHVRFEEPVALKTVRPDMAGMPGFLERFDREVRLMARLRHPHIVPSLDSGVETGRPWLAMKYIEGPRGEPMDLRQFLAERRAEDRPIAEDEAVAVGMQICDALAYAHSFRDDEVPGGILHRDLKPANILLDSDTRLYVADFGLARLIGQDFEKSVIAQSRGAARSIGDARTIGASPAATSGDQVGTLDYMSPEQREGREADARSDVYSLGAILYELLTGRKVSGVPRRFAKVRPDLDPKWDAIIYDRCLAAVPDERFASAQELKDAILGRGYFADVPTRPGPAAPPALKKPVAPASPARRRRSMHVLAVGVAAVAILVGLGVWLALGSSSASWRNRSSRDGSSRDSGSPRDGRGRASDSAPAWIGDSGGWAQWMDTAPSWQVRTAAAAQQILQQKASLPGSIPSMTLDELRSFAGHGSGGYRPPGAAPAAPPDRFFLDGQLVAVRVFDGNTWILVGKPGEARPTPVGFSGSVPAAVVFSNATLDAAMADYRAGDSVRVLVDRFVPAEAPGAASRSRSPSGYSGASTATLVARNNRWNQQIRYPLFVGRGVEKAGEDKTWVDGSLGRAEELADPRILETSPGLVLRRLGTSVGLKGIVRGKFTSVAARNGAVEISIAIPSSVEDPFTLRATMGGAAKSEEFLDYSEGDIVEAAIVLGRPDEPAASASDMSMLRYSYGPDMGAIVPSSKDPLNPWSCARADCQGIRIVGRPETQVAPRGRRRTAPLANMAQPTPDAVAVAPERFRGRKVQWEGQIVYVREWKGICHLDVSIPKSKVSIRDFEAYTTDASLIDRLDAYCGSDEGMMDGPGVRVQGEVCLPDDIPDRLVSKGALVRLTRLEREGEPSSGIEPGASPSKPATPAAGPVPLRKVLWRPALAQTGADVDACFGHFARGNGFTIMTKPSSGARIDVSFPSATESEVSDYSYGSPVRVRIRASAASTINDLKFDGVRLVRAGNAGSEITKSGRITPAWTFPVEEAAWEEASRYRSDATPTTNVFKVVGVFAGYGQSGQYLTLKLEHLWLKGYGNIELSLPTTAEGRGYLEALKPGDELSCGVRVLKIDYPQVFLVRTIARLDGKGIRFDAP